MIIIDKTKIKILVIEPDKEPYIKTIPKNLDAMRKLIETTRIEVIEYEDITLIVYDEDSFSKGLPINRYIDDMALRGIFILAGNDKKVKDFADITEEQIEKYTKQFSIEMEEDMEW